MQTIWLSPTAFVTGDASIQITYPSVEHPGTLVVSKTTGDLKWISMALPLPLNASIEDIIICYQLSSAQSFISQVRLSEMTTPNQAIVRHDDSTALKSTDPESYSSKVGGFVPTAAVSLELRINIQAVTDEIMLGAVGVNIRPSANSEILDVMAFGAKGDGVNDDTSAIQSAIDEADQRGGAIVYLGGGKTFACAGQLNLDDKRGVHLMGVAGPNGAARSQLLYTGAAAVFVSLRSCYSISFRNLQITYNNGAFTGDLIKFGWSLANADPGYCLFEGCYFGGTGAAASGPAASLMNLSKLLVSTVRNCAFGPANIGIHGAAESYSNAIQIHDSVFSGQNEVAIQNAGEAWLVSGCTFEPLSSQKSGAYKQTNQYSWGLTFIGCWMGDVTAAGGSWIDTTPGAVLGLAIINNRIAAAGPGPDDSCIRLPGGQGVTIIGNRIEGPIGIDFTGYTLGVFIGGNDFQCVEPLRHVENPHGFSMAGNNNVQSVFDGRTTFLNYPPYAGTIHLSPGWMLPDLKNGSMWVTTDGPDSALFVMINGQPRKVALL